MALIVMLAGVGLAVYGNSVTRGKEAVLKEDLFRMRDAIDQYYADKNKYPPTLESLVSEKYLRAIPVDPFTASAETWQTTMSELDAGQRGDRAGHLRRQERVGVERARRDALRKLVRMMRNDVRNHARLTGVALLAVAQLAVIACDKMPLTAPSSSTVTVTGRNRSAAGRRAAPRSPRSSSEDGGTPVQNGTMVRFTTDLGRVDPVEAQTRNGLAITTFHRRRRVGGGRGSRHVRQCGRRPGATAPLLARSRRHPATLWLSLSAARLSRKCCSERRRNSCPSRAAPCELIATVIGVGVAGPAGHPGNVREHQGYVGRRPGGNRRQRRGADQSDHRPRGPGHGERQARRPAVRSTIMRRAAPPARHGDPDGDNGRGSDAASGQPFTFQAAVTVTGDADEERPAGVVQVGLRRREQG